MKKNKLLILLTLVFGMFMIPFFAGCKDAKITLASPNSVSYQTNDETGIQMLVTERNVLASAYLFGVSEFESDNPDDFVKWTVPATEKKVVGGVEYEIPHNYLDVSNIFLNAKTYYFYSQYVGTDKYISSQISPISSVTIEHKLDTPSAFLTDMTLNWLRVDNANVYAVYSNINGVKELVSTTENLSYNLSTYITNKINDGLEQEIGFTVVALSNQNFSRSAESEEIVYNEFLQLETPNNLNIVKNNSQFLFEWSLINHCDNYTLKVNYNEDVVIRQSQCSKVGNKLRYDLTSLFQHYGLGEYTFKIRANNTNSYIQSTYSEEYDYVYTEKLPTPENILIEDANPNVIISWNEVEDAIEYELYYSDIANGYSLKKFIVNDGGVEGTIVSNSIILSYSQIGITSFSQVVADRFKVQILAKGYAYFEDSDLSTGKSVRKIDDDIASPYLVDDASEQVVTWNPVRNAIKYKIFVIGENDTVEQIRTDCRYNYADAISSAGSYTIKVQAIALDGTTSIDSNEIIKETFVQLYAPTLSDVYAVGENFVLVYLEVENAVDYSLYIGGELVAEDITSQNNTFAILDALDYKNNDQVAFSLVANDNGYYMASNKSNTIVVETKLQTPEISISGNILALSNVKNAQSYNLVLDDKITNVTITGNTINLTNYVEVNVARQVRIQAVSPYFDDSDFSDKIYYNRASKTVYGFTNKYFYYGQTYDYYITSGAELFDVLEYTYINEQLNLSIYIDFDNSVLLSEKVENVFAEFTGTHCFKPTYTYNNDYGGDVTFTFKYAGKTSPQTYGPEYTQYENGMVYSVESSRENDYHFACDDYLVTEKVWTTDGLVKALEHHATPEFATASSVAEDIYNRAKAILIEICDDNMSAYEKSLAIHDYIVTHVSYDTKGLNDNIEYNKNYKDDVNNYKIGYFHYIESAIYKNMAVCDGYSKLFSLLCNMEKIDCIVVGGLADATVPDSFHAWNKISFDFDNDGEVETFAVDCTFDDYLKSGTEYLTHEYFMIPDSYLGERVYDTYAYHPYPNTTESTEKFYSYFKYEGAPLKVENMQDLSQLMTYSQFHQTFKLEILVLSQYIEMLNSPQYAMFITFSYEPIDYDHSENYTVLYVYK